MFRKTVRTERLGLQSGTERLVPYLSLIVVVVFFGTITRGRLFSPVNGKILLNEIFSIGLGAVGVLFVMAQGSLDFSIGAIIGFASALAALAAKISLGLILPVALCVGILVGLFNGFIYAKLNVPAFIATLAVSFILKGITSVILNGSIGVPFAMSVYDNVPLKLVVFLSVWGIGYMIFEYTGFGKQCRAIGASASVSELSGVHLTKVKLLSYVISGGTCGIISFFSLARTCTAANGTGSGAEFNVLLALMIGGLSFAGGWTAKFHNAVIGSIIMAVISNGMTLWGIDGLTQQLVKGALFIFAVSIAFDRKTVAVIK